MVTELSTPSQIMFSKDRIPFSLRVTDAGGAVYTSLPKNYKLEAEVFLNNNSLTTLTEIPKADGMVEIDISSVVHAGILEAKNVKLPAFFSNAPYDPEISYDFNIRYREVFDGNTPTWTATNTQRVLLGGVGDSYNQIANFITQMNADNSYLSWYPSRKSTSKAQPEYLTWFNYTGAAADVHLEVQALKNDKTVSTVLVHNAAPFTTAINAAVTFPVGHDALGLESVSTEVLRYSVRVMQGTTPVSPYRHFDVDYHTYTEDRILLYFNGFGVPEVARFVGELTKDLQVDRQEAEAIITSESTFSDREIYQFDQTFNNTFTYRSGYRFSKAEVDALQEMLIYNDAYDVRAYGYLPIRILDKKFKITETFKYLHTVTFKASRSRTLQRYNRITYVSQCTDGWEEINGSCWLTEDSTDKWLLQNG